MTVKIFYGPPGTGKTKRLVGIARDHGRGLFLSYTRAAAAEAASRLTGIEPSTLHSYAFRALNMNRASVVDKPKLSAFGKTIGIPFQNRAEGDDELQEGDEYLQVYSFSRNRMIEPDLAYDEFGRPGTHDRWRLFCDGYQKWKDTYGYMDFDDMLVRFVGLNKKYAFPCVYVDEAQDCSPLQWAALDRICTGAGNVYLAGDDDQAIYEWNGADPHGMLAFEERHRGEHEVLRDSYRVPRKVYAAVNNKLMKQMERRVKKTWKPRDAEGSILTYGDVSDVKFLGFTGMILGRDRWRVEEIKHMLNREMIPYRAPGGMSPWTSKIAEALRKKEKVDIPPHWQEFYAQADLSQPINIDVSTIHQAKGREAGAVIVDLQLSAKTLLGLELNRDAELRVMYVALTRTSHDLILCGENPLI